MTPEQAEAMVDALEEARLEFYWLPTTGNLARLEPARANIIAALVGRETSSLIAGWNACRKSLYAVCEDVQNEADRLQITTKPGTASEEQRAEGYYAGTRYAAKSIARGFNSMNAMDDDNLRAIQKDTPDAK